MSCPATSIASPTRFTLRPYQREAVDRAVQFLTSKSDKHGLLEFGVVVPMDGITTRIVEQYYKATCFLSMEAVQRDMEYEEGQEPSADEQAALQGAADGGSTDAESGDIKPKATSKKKTRKKRGAKK